MRAVIPQWNIPTPCRYCHLTSGQCFSFRFPKPDQVASRLRCGASTCVTPLQLEKIYKYHRSAPIVNFLSLKTLIAICTALLEPESRLRTLHTIVGQTLIMATPPSDLPEMEYRFVGRSGLQVSAISLGGWLTYGGHVDDGRSDSILIEELFLCNS